jgi:hypothetical protein
MNLSDSEGVVEDGLLQIISAILPTGIVELHDTTIPYDSRFPLRPCIFQGNVE